MSEPPAEPLADVTDWLYTQPRWLRSAAADVLAGARMSDDKIIEYAQFASAEAAGTLAEPGISIGLGSLAENSGGAVSLVSIADVTGIGQLKPRNPLSFGEEKLVVVFGPNGSGKSSYVRILKHACGARQKGDIHPNVFNALAEPARSSITFRTVDGQKTVEWGPSTDSIPQLSTVDIFDTSCGHSYLATEGKPTYEPQVLVFLSELATLSTQVATELGRQIAAHLTTLPSLPPDYLGTRAGKWYESLKPQTDQKDIEDNCGWSTADEEVLAELTKTLVERSPQDRAKEFETKATFVSSLIENVTRDFNAFSDDSCRALMSLRRVAREKQQIAEAAAEGNLRAAVLSGVGTEQWLALWEIARRYSSEVAYPEFAFPNVSTNARCLLCHQELTTEASHRLKAFDEYVADEAAAAARAAKAACAQAFLRLDSLPSDEMLEAKIASSGLDEHASRSLAGFYTLLRARRQQLISDVAMEHLGELPNIGEWLLAAQTVIREYAAKRNQFREGCSEDERTAKRARQREFLARKWVHQQKSAVETEVKRLQVIAILTKARDLCGTRLISLKKSALSEQLITPRYVSRFNAELKSLGATRVQVELVKTRVERGAVLHQVRLQNAVHNNPIQEVLSEGEHRIVCVAAFLADASSNPNGSTLVFDDPISSLDMDYEEAVVRRLVELSASRQVIVFTHRLSLLGMVKDCAKKAKMYCRVVQIRKQPWGAGEPDDEAIETAQPKAVLNTHLPKRISDATAVLEKEGDASYRVLAQSICTETRKAIEKIIEIELLADVIQRHRRAIITQGKLGKLADITPADCEFLEEMMTKYSRYEHAQTAEAPVPLPLPDELSEDVAKLKAWRDSLESRRK